MSTARIQSDQPLAPSFEDWFSLGQERFGVDPADWHFVCPSCSDVASGHDFATALVEHPRYNRDRTPVAASEIVGRECIGRTLGALLRSPKPYSGRGCDWAAYGLFRGPVVVHQGERQVGYFRFATTKTA